MREEITIIAAPALFTFLNFFLCFNFFLSHMGREMGLGAGDEGGWAGCHLFIFHHFQTSLSIYIRPTPFSIYPSISFLLAIFFFQLKIPGLASLSLSLSFFLNRSLYQTRSIISTSTTHYNFLSSLPVKNNTTFCINQSVSPITVIPQIIP